MIILDGTNGITNTATTASTSYLRGHLISIFSKPSVLNVDCFTLRPDVLELAPMLYGHECYPDWWRALPSTSVNSTYYPQPTMKKCTGFIEHYQNTLCIPMWCDFALETSNGGFAWKFADNKSTAVAHDPAQRGTYASNYH